MAAELRSLVDERVIACVDEWQWVDAETRATLAGFSARCCSAGTSAGPFAELRVGPLDPVSAARLIADDVPLLVRERILREAAGRPLALIELPQAFAGAGDGELLGSWAPLTPALEEAFAAGAEQLDDVTAPLSWSRPWTTPATCATVLAAASRLTGHSLERTVLAPAVALGLIELDGEQLHLAHPLTRAAVRRRADPATRRPATRPSPRRRPPATARPGTAPSPPRASTPALAAELEAVVAPHPRPRRLRTRRRRHAPRRPPHPARPRPRPPLRSPRPSSPTRSAASTSPTASSTRPADARWRPDPRRAAPRPSSPRPPPPTDPELAPRLRWRAAPSCQAVGGRRRGDRGGGDRPRTRRSGATDDRAAWLRTRS